MTSNTSLTPSQLRFEAVKERLYNAIAEEPAPEPQWCHYRTVLRRLSKESLLDQWDTEMGGIRIISLTTSAAGVHLIGMDKIGSIEIISMRPSAAGMDVTDLDVFEWGAEDVVFLMHEAIAREQNAGVEGDSNWGLIASEWREQIRALLEFLDSATQEFLIYTANLENRTASLTPEHPDKPKEENIIPSQYEAARKAFRNNALRKPDPEIEWCEEPYLNWCEDRAQLQSMSEGALEEAFDYHMEGMYTDADYILEGYATENHEDVLAAIADFEQGAIQVVYLIYEATDRDQCAGRKTDSKWAIIASIWQDRVQVLLDDIRPCSCGQLCFHR